MAINQKLLKNTLKNHKNLRIKVFNTGLKTMTGGRIKRLAKILNKESFLLTCGMSPNVNIKNLIKFHQKKKKSRYFNSCEIPMDLAV